MSHDCLVEIQTEELPPKALNKLAHAFLHEIKDRLHKLGIVFQSAHSYATPRRLAVLINKVTERQTDSVIERKGPALQAAFDKEGQPTPACLGFARSCGVLPTELQTIKNEQGAWVSFKQEVKGKLFTELAPTIVQEALVALPIPKRMRWGAGTVEFIRPVHSVILLYGNQVIDTTLLGCQTGRKTRGHRFLSQGWIEIDEPEHYVTRLKKAYVIVDFDERKKIISESARALNPNVHITENLLNEVAGLVEWPVAITGQFDPSFLAVPQEALISAMQDHQRYFPVLDASQKLCPSFIAITNIESKNPARVRAGNERVLRARLADAAFFFETDKKIPLADRVEKLQQMVFYAKLGSLYDKAERLALLAEFIAKKMAIDSNLAKQAGRLAKADLTTELVGEFPELQGIAGFYYALHDGLNESIAKALNEQYMPRFSGDQLPTTPFACAVALADRLDTLIGVFGLNQLPTGDKDPFGLRRATLGVLRILIEKQLNLDLRELLEFAFNNYQNPLANKNVLEDVLAFMLERLKPYYQDQGITPDVLAAVTALKITHPYDIHCRIQAVQTFKKMTEAEALGIANKRVSNILAKYADDISLTVIDEQLFETDAERVLAEKLREQQHNITVLSSNAHYQDVLSELAHLRAPIDNFFDTVLVMTDDKSRRENRLLILKQVRELFLQVADIALLN